MHITRRHLLALTAGTAAAGAIGAGGLVISWWNQPADQPYRHLTSSESAFVRAWSSTAFPATKLISLDGSSANLDRFFDEMLGAMPGDTDKLLRLLLNGLNNLPLTSHATPFHKLPKAAQAELFDNWSHSNVSAFRSAIQSLTLLLGMGWSTHPDVSPFMEKMHSCGYGR